MFTIQEIQEAHSKVKSGNDFPQFIKDLKEIGVKIYETHVVDGHTEYFGRDGHSLASQPKYDQLKIAETSQYTQFRSILRFHQEGKSDYLSFCREVAAVGIAKWIVDVDKMNCVYFNSQNVLIYEESIPE